MASPTKTDAERIEDANEIIRKQSKTILDLNKLLRKRTEVNDTAESIREQIYALDAFTPDPPKWLDKPEGKNTSGIPMVTLSDWHWGEYVDPDQVGGANKFNRAIGRQRVKVLYETVTDLCFNHMTTPNYEGIAVNILGDMITGAIHDDLRETNDGPVQVSVIEVEEQLIGLLNGFADKFGKVFAICVPGNHGRSTLKPRAKNRVYDSFEWNIYQHLERYFRNDPRVSVHVPNDVDGHYTTFGHRLMVTHGDALGVKGGDGIIGALGPIARGAVKVGTQARRAGTDFDTLVIGHYHVHIPRGDAIPVLANGCLIGFNEYAHTILRVPVSRPSQSLAFIHPKHGFTAQWPMYLDGKRMAKSTEPWVTWDKNLGLDPVANKFASPERS